MIKIKSIHATSNAFAVITDDKNEPILAWGYEGNGGYLNETIKTSLINKEVKH